MTERNDFADLGGEISSSLLRGEFHSESMAFQMETVDSLFARRRSPLFETQQFFDLMLSRRNIVPQINHELRRL
jgi:hypothetical protein